MTDQSNPEYLRQRTLNLIQSQYTMTLATSGDEGAWAAPVYYVYTAPSFSFFSAPDSRHIRESLSEKRSAATVFSESNTYKKICGIQMAGEIRPVPMGPEAVDMLKRYTEKFPFVKEMLCPGKPKDIAALMKQFRVRPYVFIPHQIYYSDNQLGFGFRTVVALDISV